MIQRRKRRTGSSTVEPSLHRRSVAGSNPAPSTIQQIPRSRQPDWLKDLVTVHSMTTVPQLLINDYGDNEVRVVQSFVYEYRKTPLSEEEAAALEIPEFLQRK